MHTLHVGLRVSDLELFIENLDVNVTSYTDVLGTRVVR
jgi:catechol 2,3-dioxygenase-like lactoylglutathione lyase family enzyme